jgi:hypothetical protein
MTVALKTSFELINNKNDNINDLFCHFIDELQKSFEDKNIFAIHKITKFISLLITERFIEIEGFFEENSKLYETLVVLMSEEYFKYKDFPIIQETINYIVKLFIKQFPDTLFQSFLYLSVFGDIETDFNEVNIQLIDFIQDEFGYEINVLGFPDYPIILEYFLSSIKKEDASKDPQSILNYTNLMLPPIEYLRRNPEIMYSIYNEAKRLELIQLKEFVKTLINKTD